ncbi:MAG: hypothetical protein NXH72_14880 [Hyphomonadaceae bacterium]|nr:hypothetical protein [Hyphomonadaceae bacterium]
MPFEYVSVEEAIAADGVRMVVVGNVPSPWGEAAKGILHMKSIPWKAVRRVYDSEAFNAWAKDQSGPIAIFNDEAPRSGWREILELAERLAPTPSLIAHDEEAMFALCHDLVGENGLGWARRLQLVDAGLKGEGGFVEGVAKYIGRKYGYAPETGTACAERVQDLLTQLSDRLVAQRAAGSSYYFGDAPSAADVYSATVMAMFSPLADAQCAMNPNTRAAFNTLDAATQAALDPIILQHRDHMYEQHLELPLSL